MPAGFSSEYCEGLAEAEWWADMLCGTMYAALAVATSSLVESTIVELNAFAGKSYPQRTPSRHELFRDFERCHRVKMEDLPGYQTQRAVQYLANSFKHNDGAFNKEAAKHFGARPGDKIRWLELPWTEMIDDTVKFVGALCKEGRDSLI